MNLVKIANLLKDAPDQSLIQEMQNPSGSVPSYMVLSELQRRKKLRGAMMSPEPETSVAEDQVAAFTPSAQAGIGSLGAAGAVSQPAQAPVSMASGGEVKGYYGGGSPEVGSYEDYEQSMGLNRPSIWGYSSDVENEKKRQELMAKGMTRAQADAFLSSPAAKSIPAQPSPPAPTAPAPTAPAPTAPAPVAKKGIPGAAPAQSVTNTTALSQEAQDMAAARASGIEGLGQYNKYLKEAIDANKAQKAENAWQAVTMAGLGMLGGESQYAAKNIGQGALMGMQQFTGAEQSRQKEGRALAMDMAQSGLKKSDIYTNLAKLGYEGKKAEALAEKAYAEARLEVPAKAQYYKDMGAAAGTRGAGTGVSQEAIRLDKYIDNESAKLKDFTIPKDERARIRANIDAAQRRLAELSGLSTPTGGSVAPTGGSLAPGKDGRFVYTPGG